MGPEHDIKRLSSLQFMLLILFNLANRMKNQDCHLLDLNKSLITSSDPYVITA